MNSNLILLNANLKELENILCSTAIPFIIALTDSYKNS